MGIELRDKGASDYPVIGWIVTGSIWPMAVRLFANKKDAQSYAKVVHKYLQNTYVPAVSVVIEYRTDTCGLTLEHFYK